MRIVALEEHFVSPEVMRAWQRVPAGRRGVPDLPVEVLRRLEATPEQRRAVMDDQGVDVQVLSLNSPGLQTVTDADAAHLARDSNDALAGMIAADPARFQGLAALPTADPGAAADELERCISRLGFRGALINGRTDSLDCDDPAFEPIWSTAERVRAPVYLHPQTPAAAVRSTYYSGFTSALDGVLATTAIGWHFEAGLQLLRMVTGGVFDRHPDLQVILGHWGEVVLFFLERTAPELEQAGLRLARPLRDVFRQNVWVTGGGILSERYLRWSVEVLGSDRIMSATDYPWVDNGGGRARAFIEQAPLAPAEKDAIASGNWERLTGVRRSVEGPRP